MSIILNIITELKANDAINNFFTTHYNKPPKHFLGYKQSPTPAELPCLCYLPIDSTINDLKPSFWNLSIVIMLEDDRLLDETLTELDTADVVTGDIQLFSGLVRSEQAQVKLMSALQKIELDGAVINPNFKIKTDLNLVYPFFESYLLLETTALNYY